MLTIVVCGYGWRATVMGSRRRGRVCIRKGLVVSLITGAVIETEAMAACCVFMAVGL